MLEAITTRCVAFAPVRCMGNPLVPCRRFERCRDKNTGCTDGVLTTSGPQEVAALRNKLSLAEAGDTYWLLSGPRTCLPRSTRSKASRAVTPPSTPSRRSC